MGVQNPNQRPTPKAAPKPAPRAPQARPLAPAFRPISNPVKALATIPKKSPQQKLARALKPIGSRPAEVVKPFANPVQSLAQLHPASAMVAEKHLIEAHQRSSEVAKNLYNTAFDPKETLSHRLSAARILREHYAFPVSQSDYVAAVQPKSPKTDVHHSLLHNILHGVESGAVSVANVPLGLANEAYQVHDQRTRGGTASSVSGAVDQLKALGHEAYRAHDQATQEGVGGVGYVAAVPAAVKALAEHPGKVLGASGRSLPGFAEGIVAGPVKALMDPAGAVRGITADTKAFEQNPRKYVEQQGIIGPALNVGAVGAGVGRLAGLGAEEGAFGARAAEVMAKRPDLRFAQGPMGVVRQERSKNFFKAAGQKAIDTKRAKADVGRTGPVKAGEGEVTPLLHENVGGKNVHITSTVNKKIGKSAAFQQQVAHNRYQQELIRQKHLFQSEMPKALTHDQWHSALRVAVERGIRTPAQAKAYLPKLIEQIKAIRAVNPRHNLADELPHAPAQGKKTNYTLLHQGAAVHDPAVLEQAFAQQLKQAHGVNAAARIANNFRIREYVQDGEAHQIPDKGMTLAKVQRVQQLPGYEHLMPWNPKVFYKELQNKDKGEVTIPGKQPLSAFHSATDGVAKSGWHLIPEAIYKEMQQGYKGNSGAQRFFSHAKGLQSTAILGILHPSWPAFRIFHNLFASAVGGVNPTKAFEIGRKLTPEQADMLNQIAVSNPLRYEDKPARFGSTIAPRTFGDKVRTAYNSQSPTARAIRGLLTSPKTIAKPAFRLEAKQMAHFQQSAAFQKLDHDAKATVKGDVTGLVDTVNKAHDKLLKDPKYQEELARHVEKIFGDFTHYPGVHKFFSQNLMFYGYLRYATRFVLKTLPTEHPITTSILYQLEKQNEENTRKVLKLRPNEPLPPGAASQVFWRNASGALQHINLHRLNPFGALPIENATNPAKTAVSSLPFLPQMALENVFNYDLTRGAPWRVKGKSVQTGPTNFDQVKLADRGRILGADLLNNLAPVRVLEGAQDKGMPMGNDSLPWSKRPVVRAKLDAAVYDQLAHQRNRGLLDALIKTEAPFIPSPSTEDLSVLKGRAFQKETALQKAQDKLQVVQTPGFGKAVVPAAQGVAIQKAIDKVNKAVQDGGLTKAAGAQIVKNLQKMKG